MAKLWAGRFGKETDLEVNDFNSSISFDCRLYKEDITGSMAHAAMLGKQGIIAKEESDKIIEGLKGILADIEAGKIHFSQDYEDIHMNVEQILTERIGDAGKRPVAPAPEQNPERLRAEHLMDLSVLLRHKRSSQFRLLFQPPRHKARESAQIWPQRQQPQPRSCKKIPPEAARPQPFFLAADLRHDGKDLLRGDRPLDLLLRVADEVERAALLRPEDAVHDILPVRAAEKRHIPAPQRPIRPPEADLVAPVAQKRRHALPRHGQAERLPLAQQLLEQRHALRWVERAHAVTCRPVSFHASAFLRSHSRTRTHSHSRICCVRRSHR